AADFARPPFSGTEETLAARRNRRTKDHHREECCSSSTAFGRVLPLPSFVDVLRCCCVVKRQGSAIVPPIRNVPNMMPFATAVWQRPMCAINGRANIFECIYNSAARMFVCARSRNIRSLRLEILDQFLSNVSSTAVMRNLHPSNVRQVISLFRHCERLHSRVRREEILCAVVYCS